VSPALHRPAALGFSTRARPAQLASRSPFSHGSQSPHPRQIRATETHTQLENRPNSVTQTRKAANLPQLTNPNSQVHYESTVPQNENSQKLGFRACYHLTAANRPKLLCTMCNTSSNPQNPEAQTRLQARRPREGSVTPALCHVRQLHG
jgi:hypothetical protein